jgi:hypothetical protein
MTKMHIPTEIKALIAQVRLAWEPLKEKDTFTEQALAQFDALQGEAHRLDQPDLYTANVLKILDFFILQAPQMIEDTIAPYERSNVLSAVKALVNRMNQGLNQAAAYLDATNCVPFLLPTQMADKLYVKMHLLEWLFIKLAELHRDSPDAVSNETTALLTQFVNGKPNENAIHSLGFVMGNLLKILLSLMPSRQRLPSLSQRLDDYTQRFNLERLTLHDIESRYMNHRSADEKTASYSSTAKILIEDKKLQRLNTLKKAIPVWVEKLQRLELEESEQEFRLKGLSKAISKAKREMVELEQNIKDAPMLNALPVTTSVALAESKHEAPVISEETAFQQARDKVWMVVNMHIVNSRSASSKKRAATLLTSLSKCQNQQDLKKLLVQFIHNGKVTSDYLFQRSSVQPDSLRYKLMESFAPSLCTEEKRVWPRIFVDVRKVESALNLISIAKPLPSSTGGGVLLRK